LDADIPKPETDCMRPLPVQALLIALGDHRGCPEINSTRMTDSQRLHALQADRDSRGLRPKSS